jgi:hypothetical protein
MRRAWLTFVAASVLTLATLIPAAAYEDNVVSWPSVEPADDYTANSLMAFVLGAAGLG